MVETSINALLLHRFSDKDTFTMVIEIHSTTFWIAFSYLEHDCGLSPPEEPINRLATELLPIDIKDIASYIKLYGSFMDLKV